jgi:thiol:disulfide interchange protein DsbD
MKYLHVLVRLLWLFCAVGLAGTTARAAEDFLDPEVAFKATARPADDRTVEVVIEIAPGYYLYREQFKFEARGATLGTPAIPTGKVKFDETFQKNVETHRDTLRIPVPVVQANGPFRLAVDYQGCADKGLCYPPAQMRADVSLAAFGGNGSVRVLPGREMPIPGASAGAETEPLPSRVAINTASATDSGRIEAALKSGSFALIVAVFFAAGVLLSLTPCVLPMLPILSSIIVGHGEVPSRRRGLALAVSYSLGMALIYTALGIAAGLAGEGLAAYLQNPWALGLFALALVVLSLSMFGVYEFRLPSALTSPLSQASQRLPGGRFAGVFAMGGVSALIVSPCVAAPLAGALVYLSQTRDVSLGGSALFALAMGMSVPLLLLGASAGAFLPKAGAWMDDVKRIFGVMLLAVAIWIVQPVLPASLALVLWGLLLVAGAVLVWPSRRSTSRRPVVHGRRIAGAALALFGVLEWAGAASGGHDPMLPLAHLSGQGGAASVLPFKAIKSVADLDNALQAARSTGRAVMLDFYADWCVSCKEMERFTFADPTVQAALTGAVLLKADVTLNDAQDRALLKRFSLFGPPGTIFFDRQGEEITRLRVIGYQDSDRFMRTLHAAGL